jgi:GT2 family glycosyltransferase
VGRVPEVSVVIPTRRRETRLAFALEALAEQTLGLDRFEVIVVRAPDAVDGALTAAPDGLAVRFLTSAVAGPAAQRNLGWRESEAPLIAFTDDDCRPAPDWLEHLVDAQAGPDTILQGRTEPDPDERHLLWGLARSWEIVSPNLWYATCNVAYPRALLERLDGFDERFPAAWGEDTDLGLRGRELGAKVAYVDAALVWHAVLVRWLPQALREAARHDATPVVVARHPIHREALHARVFVHDRHPRLMLAIAGALGLRRRPVIAVLAMVPYLLLHLNWRYLNWRHPAPLRLLRQAAHVPIRATVDGVETVVTIRSAIRNRVFVL